MSSLAIEDDYYDDYGAGSQSARLVLAVTTLGEFMASKRWFYLRVGDHRNVVEEITKGNGASSGWEASRSAGFATLPSIRSLSWRC